ncbi:GGDEF domain-containing protein [Paenibacillus mesotrionivorans]|uniref:GGDEF domain-containing protein n=1 Tax=Paenibacillus mesotrionivorans TaxID=3160968 RepID=A0ACC7P4C1_9BACL
MIALLRYVPSLYIKLFEHHPFAMLTITAKGRPLLANAQARALLEAGRDGTAASALLENSRLLEKLAENKSFGGLDISVYQAGRRREFRIDSSLIRGLFRPVFLLSVQDVTASSRHLRRLRHQATRDSLTGVWNRGAFLEKLEAAIVLAEQEGYTLAVLYIDVDEFKEINTAYGHEGGDAVLAGVARIIARIVGRKGAVGRLGGDELAVFMHPVPSYTEISGTLLELTNAIRAMDIPYKGQTIRVEASFGASLYAENSEDAATLLNRADKAMYRMKEVPLFD